MTTGRAFLVVLVVMLFAFVLALRFVVARPMLFPASQDRLPETVDGGKVVAYRTSDGLTLRGVLYPSGKENAPGIVFFHGNGEAAVHNIVFGRTLAALGADVFLADYRGYGGNPGFPSEAGLFLDGKAAVAASGFPLERLVLLGRSLGTGVAAEMALHHPARLVILISPFTSVVEMGRGVVGPLSPLVVRDPFDTLSKVGKIRSPLVVVHGTADEIVPFRMGEAIVKARPGTRFVPLEGRTHNDASGQELVVWDEIRRAVEAEGARPRGGA